MQKTNKMPKTTVTDPPISRPPWDPRSIVSSLCCFCSCQRRGISKAAIQKATCLACPCWKKLSQILALNTWSPIDAKVCCSKKSTDRAALRWSLVLAEEQTTESQYSSCYMFLHIYIIFTEPWLLRQATRWKWRWTHKVSYIPDLLGPWETQSWHISAWKVQIQAASSFVPVHECQCMERPAWKVMKVLHVLLLFQVNDRGMLCSILQLDN